jgi:hypothetical protein
MRRAWLGLVLVLCPLVAHAARTITADGPLVVKLELQQVTGLILTENVSTIVTGMPKERLDISFDGPNIGLVLYDPTMPPTRVLITGESGRIYLPRVEVAPARGDDLVYVTHRPTATAVPVTVASAIRAVLGIPGAPQGKSADPIIPATTDPRLTLHSAKSLTLGPFVGTAIIVENTQDVPVLLDERVGHPGEPESDAIRLDTWIWPPKYTLEAVGPPQQILPPHGRTTLYFIFRGR